MRSRNGCKHNCLPCAYDVVQRAQASNGGPVYAETAGMLHRYAADVIERFSPQEEDLISGLRAPLVIK